MGRRILFGTAAGLALALAGCTGPSAGTPVALPSASVMPTAPTSPSPAPSADPEPTSRPALEACGTTLNPLDATLEYGALPEPGSPLAPVWIGDYGGGTAAEPGEPFHLRWSVHSQQDDWSHSDVTATVNYLLLTHLDDPTVVVAVSASELPAPTTLPFSEVVEGGGSGSEAQVDLTMPFQPCVDAGADLPVGVYWAVLGLTLEADGTTYDQHGPVEVFVGGFDAAVAATASWGVDE